MVNEPREISVRGSPNPGSVGIRMVDGPALEVGRQVEARVVGVLDNGTVSVRIGGNVVRLDGEALAAATRSFGATGGLPEPGTVLRLQYLERSPVPKFVLTGIVASPAGDQGISLPPPIILPGEVGVAPQPSALLQTGLDALAVQFPNTNIAEARAVISALIRFQVAVTNENFRVVLASVGQPAADSEVAAVPAASSVDGQAAPNRGMSLQQLGDGDARVAQPPPAVRNHDAPMNWGSAAAKAFAGRAEMAAFLLSKGVVPSAALVSRIVGDAGTAGGPAPQQILSAPDIQDSVLPHGAGPGPTMIPEDLANVVAAFVRQMRVQKVSMAMPAVSEAMVEHMLGSPGRLEVIGAAIEAIVDLFRGAGRADLAAQLQESAGLPSTDSKAALPARVSQALAALLSLVDEYVIQSAGQGQEIPAGAKLLGLQQAARTELAQKIAFLVKDMPHGELMLLAGELENLERSEIARSLGTAGTRMNAQNEAAGRAIALKMLDLVASSGAERVAHFEIQLPAAASGTQQTARIRVAWREEEGKQRKEVEPREIAILLRLSGLGKVVASLNFSGKSSVAVRFFVQNGEVRSLFARFQDQLRASLTGAGFESNISVSVRNPDDMPNPFAPSSGTGEHAPGTVDFTV